MLPCGGSAIDIEAKVHMDTSGIHRRPLGAPKIAKKSLKNGFSREKMKKTDQNSSIRSNLELVLLPKHKTRSMTQYGAVEKNLGLSGGL